MAQSGCEAISLGESCAAGRRLSRHYCSLFLATPRMLRSARPNCRATSAQAWFMPTPAHPEDVAQQKDPKAKLTL